MTLDPAIREQTYQYFLQEAPELLRALEQGLLNFKTDRGINQVNNLMRITHTLKGAATSIELDTIATIAHSLEDIFKALCQPNLSIQPDVEALLFEGVECLRIPLVAELTGGAVNHAEVLDRAAAIFAQLQEQLGDCFDQVSHLPSSVELGFDVTLSIFELGVAQRLDQLAASLEHAKDNTQSEDVAEMLRTQADVFLGLAESLNLPGFRAIAHTVLAALDRHPDQVLTITEVALADFRAGQAAVLAGDRSQGGQPSKQLQQLANFDASSVHLNINEQADIPEEGYLEEHQQDTPTNEAHLLIDSIWGGHAIDSDSGSVELTSGLKSEEVEEPAASIALSSSTHYNPNHSNEPTYRIVPSQPVANATVPLPHRDAVPPSSRIRVDVKYLDQLNHSIGELITNQNRQLLQTEQLQTTVHTLFSRLKQHQQLLNQLRDQSRQQNQLLSKTAIRALRNQPSKLADPKAQHISTRIDALFNKNLPLIQTLLDDMIQLTEVADAIDLFTQQASQTLEQQQQLLAHTRNTLIEARMLPLGEIFNRLPSVLQQLETLYSKPVTLELRGMDVLVDKVIAEKLYDPLLHLVRNAFDHGIEPISLRQQYGKPEQGKIEICAYNQGRYLVIEVQDDGKGLEFDQIRKRAVERHLISLEQASTLSDTQLINFLFEPGFSTAVQINDISGRGIGLDVVKSQIQTLNGTVSVQTSPHQGTTFLIQIPLNLTIAQLLVCEADGKFYTLLDDAIEQIVLPDDEQIQKRSNCRVLNWGEGSERILVPIHALSNILRYASTAFSSTAVTSDQFSDQFQSQPLHSSSPNRPIILIRHQNMMLGLEVDHLVGEQELIIRPLGNRITPPSYVHGASIIADGRLSLVIDAAMLIQTVISQQYGTSHNDDWGNDSSYRSSYPPSRVSLAGLPLLANSSSMPEPTRLLQAQSPAEIQAQIHTQIHTQTHAPVNSQDARPVLSGAIHTIPKSRILIVDDSITTRQNLALILQKAGYQTAQAQNGYDAIAQLEHQPDIQLVICDLEMPVMNGFEFLRHLQHTPTPHNIPVLILTSRSDETCSSLALQLGATAYMTKPYIEHKLLAAVAGLTQAH